MFLLHTPGNLHGVGEALIPALAIASFEDNLGDFLGGLDTGLVRLVLGRRFCFGFLHLDFLSIGLVYREGSRREMYSGANLDGLCDLGGSHKGEKLLSAVVVAKMI